MRPTTSRTGTSTYLRNRKRLIQQAKHNGLEHCPRCNTHLNYEQPGQPNSVEADHITPHSKGGTDHLNNLQILCRTCNRTLSNKKTTKPTPTRHQPTTKNNW